MSLVDPERPLEVMQGVLKRVYEISDVELIAALLYLLTSDADDLFWWSELSVINEVLFERFPPTDTEPTVGPAQFSRQLLLALLILPEDVREEAERRLAIAGINVGWCD